jgi:hypothetical protein
VLRARAQHGFGTAQYFRRQAPGFLHYLRPNLGSVFMRHAISQQSYFLPQVCATNPLTLFRTVQSVNDGA